MGDPTRWVLCVGLAAAAACSPFGGGAFHCTEDQECVGAGRTGYCEANGFCSFDDATCGSGRRYGEASGDLGGVCVGDEPVDASTDPDGGPPADAPCMVAGIDLCATPDPALTFGTETINTDSDPRCRALAQPGGPQACLILAASITVPAGVTVGATGGRPLVLAGRELVGIDGAIDVASVRGGTAGPNANFGGCPAYPTAPREDRGGGGGGAGASFAALGAGGGEGDNDNSADPPGPAPGGTPAGAEGAPAFARGGCAGQNGANETSGGGDGGSGGRSGGGIWIVAGGQVRIGATGSVRATGEGGDGGEVQAGGGGGGSGGLILLAGSSVRVEGQLAANGGGGGGGGARISGQPISGSPGTDGALGTSGAAGGPGAMAGPSEFGGRGGTGGAAAGDASAGGGSIVGAGGGGGAVGYIILPAGANVTGATISPGPTLQ